MKTETKISGDLKVVDDVHDNQDVANQPPSASVEEIKKASAQKSVDEEAFGDPIGAEPEAEKPKLTVSRTDNSASDDPTSNTLPVIDSDTGKEVDKVEIKTDPASGNTVVTNPNTGESAVIDAKSGEVALADKPTEDKVASKLSSTSIVPPYTASGA